MMEKHPFVYILDSRIRENDSRSVTDVPSA